MVSPGYVFTQLARRVIAQIEEPTDVRFLLTLVTTGTEIHALMVPWTTRTLDFSANERLLAQRWEAFAWSTTAVFLLPQHSA